MRKMKATLLKQIESHLLKLSLVRLSVELKANDMDARIVACIHDSIWVESAEEEEREVREIMEAIMGTAISLSVPLPVDFEG